MTLHKNNYLLVKLKGKDRSRFAKPKGEAGETLAKYVAQMEGYSPLDLPSDSLPHDFILNNGKENYKVQVKSSMYCSWKIRKGLSFTIVERNSKIKKYDEEDVDIFALSSIEYDRVVWLLYSEVKSRTKVSVALKELNDFPLKRIIGESYLFLRKREDAIEEEVEDQQQSLNLFKGENNNGKTRSSNKK